MTLLKHPVFKDVEVEIKDDEVSEWVDAGWLKPEQRRKPEVKTALDEAPTEKEEAKK